MRKVFIVAALAAATSVLALSAAFAAPHAPGKNGARLTAPSANAGLSAKLAGKTGIKANATENPTTKIGTKTNAKLVGGTKVGTLNTKGNGKTRTAAGFKTGGPKNGSAASSRNGGSRRHHRRHHHRKGNGGGKGKGK